MRRCEDGDGANLHHLVGKVRLKGTARLLGIETQDEKNKFPTTGLRVMENIAYIGWVANCQSRNFVLHTGYVQ